MRFTFTAIALVAALHLLPAALLDADAQPGRVKAEVSVFVDSDAVHPGSVIHAALEVRLPKGYHVNSNKPLEEFLIPTVLSVEVPEGIRVIETVYPEAVLVRAGGLPDPLSVYEERFYIGVALSISEDVPTGEHTLTGTLRYQACDDKTCYAPTNAVSEVTLKVVDPSLELAKKNEDIFDGIQFAGIPGDTPPENEAEPVETIEVANVPAFDDGDVLGALSEFTVLASTGGSLSEKKFLAFIEAAETGQKQEGWFEGKGPIAIVALVLIGGLALNLTPCVLPMIPINLAIIGAGAQAGSRLKGFALGGTYGLAMAAVYGLLGLIVILTAGTFGTINSSPWFNLGITVLFVVLALAMFDVITIDFSRLQSKLNLGGKGKGTFLLAFGMGGVAALLAGACVAPAVIQVIIFSSSLYANGTPIALALPFFLGLGMALPWPIAGAGLSFLPKPGLWMVRVKQAFGVFIFGFAIYYGFQTYETASNLIVDDSKVASSVEEMIEGGWVPSLSHGLAMAKEEDKLVLVDVWATWCKNCLVMDETTFKNENVLARLEDYIKIKFQAQEPDESPAREVLKRFEGVGLPTYAILRYNGQS